MLCPKDLDSDVREKKNHRKPLTPEQILSSNVSPEMIGVRGYPQINLGISRDSVSLLATHLKMPERLRFEANKIDYKSNYQIYH